eukprot:GHVR01123754.1.p1 GENE.GHVR01123754.1~~GHVR01123754.1.p1  ORF type:complete len:107 (-),score=4.70 GHVR01123754.1:3597-3917(-)
MLFKINTNLELVCGSYHIKQIHSSINLSNYINNMKGIRKKSFNKNNTSSFHFVNNSEMDMESSNYRLLLFLFSNHLNEYMQTHQKCIGDLDYSIRNKNIKEEAEIL